VDSLPEGLCKTCRQEGERPHNFSTGTGIGSSAGGDTLDMGAMPMKTRTVTIFFLAVVLLAGCHRRAVEERREPAPPEHKVAKKDEVPRARAVPRPAVPGTDRLFTITRSQNRNQVIYEARRTGSGFDTEHPINVFWIMVEEGGTREDLNTFEKKSAYGVSVVSATKDKVVFNLKALKDRKIEVTFDNEDKTSKAFLSINGEPAELESVYINARPRKLNPKPEVLTIDIKGRSVASGKSVKEVIRP
jgi:uncharacterized protein YkuJ